MSAMSGIRSYGPGKFSLVVDSFLYQGSLEGGPDEEIGDASEGPLWVGRIDEPMDTAILGMGDDDILTAEEALFLHRAAYAIITEDSQGFVTAKYYSGRDAREAMEADWRNYENMLFVDTDDESDDDGFTFEDQGDGTVKVSCDSCMATFINGVATHETGCPNQRKGLKYVRTLSVQ